MQFNLTPIVKNLLLINLGIFIFSYMFWSYSGYDINNRLGLYSVLSENFRPEQIITFMFLHSFRTFNGAISFGHIFGNMFALFMFGPLLERFWGSKRFLIFYIVTGVGAGLLYLGVNFYETYQLRQDATEYLQSPTPTKFLAFVRAHTGPLSENGYDFVNKFEEEPTNPVYVQQSSQLVKRAYQEVLNIPMVGASGAIFGLLMAFGLLFPNTELFLLFIPFPIKAKYFVACYGIYELYSGVQRAPGDSVAHFAHLGGMLFAYIMIKYWNSKSENFY
jgi:rhomboid family protein